MADLAVVIFILGLGLSCAYTIEPVEPETLQWPPEYHLKADRVYIIGGVVEPSEIWFSSELNKSRIDYLNGSVKNYYFGETEDENGYLFKIFPMSTEEQLNEVTCLKSLHSGEAKQFLPETDELSFKEMQYLDGRRVSVWQVSSRQPGAARDVLLHAAALGDYHIPLRSDEITYNAWSGAIETHAVTTYYDYRTVNESDFTVENESYCDDGLSMGVDGDLDAELSALHPDHDAHVDLAFAKYKKHHNRKYDQTEHEMRQAIFRNNWKRVVKHNSQNQSYKLSVNKFADRTESELRALTATRPAAPRMLHAAALLAPPAPAAPPLPAHHDMRLEGIISPIKNQGSCGSCWAFATTAAVEGATARHRGGVVYDLSEQALIDCAWGYENYGCMGGDVAGAMKYVTRHGIPTEEAYGVYSMQDGKCHRRNTTQKFGMSAFGRVSPGSEGSMKKALLRYGPVVVSIYASHNFKLYSNGIFYDLECVGEESVNHAVLVVGYGERDGATYWIVKNSYGADWGQAGYMLLSAQNDICNTLTQALYPIIE